MKVAGAVAAVVLAHENVSPWLVLWWVLIVAFLAAAAVLLATLLRKWWATRVPPGWTPPAVAVLTSGTLLLVWGLSAGYAPLPLIG